MGFHNICPDVCTWRQKVTLVRMTEILRVLVREKFASLFIYSHLRFGLISILIGIFKNVFILLMFIVFVSLCEHNVQTSLMTSAAFTRGWVLYYLTVR